MSFSCVVCHVIHFHMPMHAGAQELTQSQDTPAHPMGPWHISPFNAHACSSRLMSHMCSHMDYASVWLQTQVCICVHTCFNVCFYVYIHVTHIQIHVECVGGALDCTCVQWHVPHNMQTVVTMATWPPY